MTIQKTPITPSRTESAQEAAGRILGRMNGETKDKPMPSRRSLRKRRFRRYASA